ncbi:MAG: carboxylesterase/lipase family protein [Acidimicrobiia bacterium]
MIVETTAGKVRGFEKQGVLQFRGIPYATAERFRPAVPPAPWDGVHEATEYGPIAPQNPSPLESMLGAQSQAGSEDCLVLNVFTPGVDGSRPVMVWIHGGAFVAGSGHVPWYNGANLARRGDVVVVTINYRLGALGFLHLGHLDPAFAGSGAQGIGDQVAALRWVRDNIAAFGGDAGNLTIFGESAGAMSVGTLLATPAAEGLFHRAIAQSGAIDHTHRPEVAEWVTDRFLAAAGLGADSVEGLLDLPVDEILRAQSVVETEVQQDHSRVEGPGVGALTFQPVADGAIVPPAPLEAVRAGSAAGVPVIAGTNAHEWNLFHFQARAAGTLDEARLARRLERVVGRDRVGDVLDVYRSARPGAGPDDLLCALMTDRVFRVPAIRLAEAQRPHAPRVSMYRFDRGTSAFDGALGACHAIEIPFVFDNLHRGGVEMFLGGLGEETRRLARRTSAAWTTMARTGRPEHDDLAWPAYDLERRATLLLDHTPTVAEDPDAEVRAMWDELAQVRTANDS